MNVWWVGAAASFTAALLAFLWAVRWARRARGQVIAVVYLVMSAATLALGVEYGRAFLGLSAVVPRVWPTALATLLVLQVLVNALEMWREDQRAFTRDMLHKAMGGREQ